MVCMGLHQFAGAAGLKWSRGFETWKPPARSCPGKDGDEIAEIFATSSIIIRVWCVS